MANVQRGPDAGRERELDGVLASGTLGFISEGTFLIRAVVMDAFDKEELQRLDLVPEGTTAE